MGTHVYSVGLEVGYGLAGQVEIGIVRFSDGTWNAFLQTGVGIGYGVSVEGSAALPTAAFVTSTGIEQISEQELGNIEPQLFYGLGIEFGASIPLVVLPGAVGYELDFPIGSANVGEGGEAYHFGQSFTYGTSAGVNFFVTDTTELTRQGMTLFIGNVQSIIQRLIERAELDFGPNITLTDANGLMQLRSSLLESWSVPGTIVSASEPSPLWGAALQNALAPQLSGLADINSVLDGTPLETFLPSAFWPAGGIEWDWSSVSFDNVDFAVPFATPGNSYTPLPGIVVSGSGGQYVGTFAETNDGRPAISVTDTFTGTTQTYMETASGVAGVVIDNGSYTGTFTVAPGGAWAVERCARQQWCAT